MLGVVVVLSFLPTLIASLIHCSSKKKQSKSAKGGGDAPRSSETDGKQSEQSSSSKEKTSLKSNEKDSQESKRKQESKEEDEDTLSENSSKDGIITRKKDKKKLEGEDNRTAWARYALDRPCRRMAKQFQKKIKKFVACGRDGRPLPKIIHDANPIKNRYSDVFCIDPTRVVLKNRANDYIHASYLSLPDNSIKYICAQGPLKETVEDFWAMIYQEKTKLVVMLCLPVEGNAEKCVVYWPLEKGETEKYGDIAVTFVEQCADPFEGVLLNYFDVQIGKGDVFRVWHILVSWWPDQLAPSDATPMLELHKWVKKSNDKGFPILVHCSAGVGRTATFVGLDYATQRIREDFTIEMSEIVKEMRTMRPQAIQSHIQYIFLHVLVFEHFLQEGFLKKDERLDKFFQDYIKVANKKLVKRQIENEKCAKENKELIRKATRDEVEY